MTTEAETTAAYPSYDFGGQDFYIFVRTERLYYLDADSQNGDVFNDSVYERNKTEKLNNWSFRAKKAWIYGLFRAKTTLNQRFLRKE